MTESDILAVCLMLEIEEKVIKMLLWFKKLKKKPSKKQVLNKARGLCMEVCEWCLFRKEVYGKVNKTRNNTSDSLRISGNGYEGNSTNVTNIGRKNETSTRKNNEISSKYNGQVPNDGLVVGHKIK